MINFAKNNDELDRFNLVQKLVSMASDIAMCNFENRKVVQVKKIYH
ncbi:MAG: hypothetical protein RCG16_02125 [Rickettsia hoogstraalii]